MEYESIEVKIPKKILLEVDKDKFANMMKLFTSIQLYKMNILSLGKAAELAGKTKDEIMEALSEHGVEVIRYPKEELGEEIEFLRKKED